MIVIIAYNVVVANHKTFPANFTHFRFTRMNSNIVNLPYGRYVQITWEHNGFYGAEM